jgi:ketopantoate reductase
LRAGHATHTQAVYTPKTVGKISRSDGFDLVIVATKHYQAVSAVQQYLPDAPGATILLFTANWDGTDEIDRVLPRSSLVWGYAKATGGEDARGVLIATVDPAVRLGMLQGSDPGRFQNVCALFQRAGFSLDVKANIIEWLWVHHAINAGGIGVCLWAGGIAEATRRQRTLRLGVRAVREALSVVTARGVDVASYPEAKSVLSTPVWLSSLAAAYGVRFSEAGRRILKGSHFANSADEMKRFYFDVLHTAEKLGVATPHLSALRERIEAYPACQAGGPLEPR